MTELISTMAQVPLTNGCVVKWEAIDAASGAQVAGVTVHDAVLYGYQTAPPSDGTGDSNVDPLWTPIATDLPAG